MSDCVDSILDNYVNTNGKKIVRKWLKANGCDGLIYEGNAFDEMRCTCPVRGKYFVHCNEDCDWRLCVPGYRHSDGRFHIYKQE